MLASSSFVRAAPLSSAPPSIPSSPSSQSEAPTVDEGKPTVPENGEGEKCVCVCITYLSKGELVLVVAKRGVGLVHEAKSLCTSCFLLARPLIIGYYHPHSFVTNCDMVDARFHPSILYDVK